MTLDATGSPDDQTVAALRDLCKWIEEIATGWQDQESLVRLLDLSAHILFMAEEYRLAARYWMRALEINRVHADELPRATAVRATIMESLSQLYHQTQRPLKAIDVERELVSIHQAAEQTAITADYLANALARLGASLIATDQLDDGREYLIQADEAFHALGAPWPSLARTHVRVLELLASVHRRQHRPAEARRCETRAVEVAAAPLIPVTHVIYEFNTTLTTAVDQLNTLAHEVAAVVNTIGDEGEPQLAGLAQVPGAVATWYNVANAVDNLGIRLSNQVHAIASAAGDQIAGPRPPTLLGKLAELTEWTAYTAKTRGESALLVELLDRSARVFHQAEDFRRAQTQWERALQHVDQLADTASDPTTAASARAKAIRILETQSDLCHARNRLDAAIDIEHKLLDRHRYADDRPGTARALTRLGATMATKKRYDLAQEYLTEADALFQAAGTDDPAIASSHADTLELLATMLNHQGRHAEATQRHHQAQALRAATPHPAGQS